MKKLLIIVGFVIFGLLFLEAVTNYVSKSALQGQYINNNTEYILDGPRPIKQGVDTLIIKNDNEK